MEDPLHNSNLERDSTAIRKLIITAALTGSQPTKEQNPGVPYSPKEIATAAIECWQAGASIVHIHVRDPKTGAPAHDPKLFREATDRIRAETDLIINLTTSGLHLSGLDVFEQRLVVLEVQPEICSLDIGSMNIADRVFLNPPEWGRHAAVAMKEAGAKPEIEVFELGHLAYANELISEGLIDPPPLIQICLGVRWGAPATIEVFRLMLKQIPAGAEWSVMGVGRHQRLMVALGILMGGHIRVGLEDNLYIRKGVLSQSNAEQVAWAVRMAGEFQREVAKPMEARQLLNLPIRSS
jgi:3-keto-5-aminohexanoate cleavage enzyme